MIRRRSRRASRRAAIAWQVTAAVASFLLVTRGDAGAQPGAGREQVFVRHPASWFEEIVDFSRISSDGRWAIYGRGPRLTLVDLTNGQEDRARLIGGLDELTDATFGPGDALVRQGRLKTKDGWFVEEQGRLQRTDLPPEVTLRWSPDGQKLAFWKRADSPGVVSVDTGGARRSFPMKARVTMAGWDRGGDSLLILTRGDDGLSTLERLDLAHQSTRVLARDLDANYFPPYFALSADGQSLYMALAGAGAPDPHSRHDPHAGRGLDIWEVDLATGARHIKVATSGDDTAPFVAGGWLYWTSTEIHQSVVVVPARGGDARLVIEDGELPQWRPDGRAIAATHGGWRLVDLPLSLDVEEVTVDHRARPLSTPVPLIVGFHEDFTPVWSSDGRWMAYHSHRSLTAVASYTAPGSSDDVFLRPAKGGPADERRLTDFGLEVGSPDWSPDGRHLIFSSQDRSKPGPLRPWILTLDPADGHVIEAARLPLPGGITSVAHAAWSPDGREIAMEDVPDESRHALWIVKADGSTGARLLEFPAATAGGIDWSPDGKTLFFSGMAGDRMQLFALKRAGGRARKLTNDPGNLLHPQLAPNGQWIACTRKEQTKVLWRQWLGR